jgi:hypothetical protein
MEAIHGNTLAVPEDVRRIPKAVILGREAYNTIWKDVAPPRGGSLRSGKVRGGVMDFKSTW